VCVVFVGLKVTRVSLGKCISSGCRVQFLVVYYLSQTYPLGREKKKKRHGKKAS
jgi:hypothetical protein